MQQNTPKKVLLSSVFVVCLFYAAGGVFAEESPPLSDWVFFFSEAKIGMVQPDGKVERYLDFPALKQRYWQPSKVVTLDHRCAILRSQDIPADPKASFYDKKGARNAPTHVWLYNFADQKLREIPVPGVIALMPEGDRFLVAGETDEEKTKTVVYTADFNGQNQKNYHDLNGFAYCLTLSPDGKTVAYHYASEGYKIYTLNLETGNKTLIAGESEYLNFGPEWSADGQWLVFQRCLHKTDPMHQRSDICIAKPDGSELRTLTTDQRQWFGTSYGPGDHHGGGSNFPHWSPDGRYITYTRCSEGAQTAWVYQKDRPDTDHFNCDYHPDQARGGSQICVIDSQTGQVREVTPFQEKLWVWRTEWSPDGRQIVYARAAVGELAELWVINVDGTNPRRLTAGFSNKGADFPQWLRLVTAQ